MNSCLVRPSNQIGRLTLKAWRGPGFFSPLWPMCITQSTPVIGVLRRRQHTLKSPSPAGPVFSMTFGPDLKTVPTLAGFQDERWLAAQSVGEQVEEPPRPSANRLRKNIQAQGVWLRILRLLRLNPSARPPCAALEAQAPHRPLFGLASASRRRAGGPPF